MLRRTTLLAIAFVLALAAPAQAGAVAQPDWMPTLDNDDVVVSVPGTGDAGGADQLVGRGDMLLSVGGEMVRLQGAFVDTPEVEKVVNFIANQQGFAEPFFLPEFHGDDEGVSGAGDLKYADLDDMFEDAARLIVQQQHGSTSMIQRRLKLGYNRAGRIMDQLEVMGIVGPADGSKAREVLIYDELELERYLQDLKSRS